MLEKHLDFDDGQCAICLNPQTYKSRLICGHVFCYKCILDWSELKLECPLCKQRFNSFATTELRSDIHALLKDELNVPLAESRQQRPEIIPMLLTICIDGSTTDLQHYLSNPAEYLSKIALDYRTHINDDRNVWDFIFKNPPTEITNDDLAASIERAGIQIERQSWVCENYPVMSLVPWYWIKWWNF